MSEYHRTFKQTDYFIDDVVRRLRKGQTEVYIDPQLAISIASVVLSALRLIVPIIQKCCRDEKRVIEVLRNPSEFHKTIFRWKVRSALRKKAVDCIGVRDLSEAIWQVAAELDDNEMSLLIDEIIFSKYRQRKGLR